VNQIKGLQFSPLHYIDIVNHIMALSSLGPAMFTKQLFEIKHGFSRRT